MNYLQKQADEKNESQGFYDPDYYETFDNFNPVIVPKKKPLLPEEDLNQPLPFEQAGQIQPPYGPLNVGLQQSHKIPSNTHRRFKEMDEYYSRQKQGGDGQGDVASMLREGKEQDKKMKEEIHRDHLAEMFGGANFSKEPIKSEFRENFGRLTFTFSLYR